MEIYDEAIIERSNNLRFRVNDVASLRAAAANIAADAHAEALCRQTPAFGATRAAASCQPADGIQPSDFEGLPVFVGSGDNALCGDTLTVAVALEQTPAGTTVVRDARYAGYGCALCLASADVLAEQVRGMEVGAAACLSVEDVKRMWGGLQVGRARIDCVALPVRALAAALAKGLDESGHHGETREETR